jgi:hypothetical protein
MKLRIAGFVALIVCVAACGTKSPTAPDQAKAPEQPAQDGSGFMGGN